jgi:glycosyltransferase involved in cell wall biosynthesis
MKTKSDSRIRVLYVSYPLLTVTEASAGGAEQMLWVLEREMSNRGFETTVAASAGSRVHGELFVSGEPCTQPDDFDRRNREHQDQVVAFVQQRSREGRPFDLVHDKSGSFWTRAHELDVPVLATLHLPRHFYPHDLFKHIPENVSFNCVSHSQAKAFQDLPGMPGVTPNGIALEQFLTPEVDTKRSGLLWLGRICEEKAPHLALEIARNDGSALTLAGQVYPFSYHREYFEREVVPVLREMPASRWIDSPSFEEKRRLLQGAEALLITSQVDETSSLVAMEAAACGTPVIAFNRGALTEVVEHGKTGFVVSDIAEAVTAVKQVGDINADDCRNHARQNFSSARMADGYAVIYETLVCRRTAALRL